MSQPVVAQATQSDRQKILQTLKMAFVADPMFRWLFPQAASYDDAMNDFFNAFGGSAFDQGTADTVDDLSAAALWLPPGVEPDGEQMVGLIAQHADSGLLDAAMPILEQMAHFHPEGDCWYLAVIGVDPAYTGQGLGASLMKEGVARCDRDGLLAYLESSNPRNISLYQRHGFEIIGEIQHGDSPIMMPMVRQPQ